MPRLSVYDLDGERLRRATAAVRPIAVAAFGGAPDAAQHAAEDHVVERQDGVPVGQTGQPLGLDLNPST